MIKYGFGADLTKHRFGDRVALAKEDGFDLIQIWFTERGLEIHPEDQPFPDLFRSDPFPIIIHAVLNPRQIKDCAAKLLPILKELNHQDLIIHPHLFNEDERLTEETSKMLHRQLGRATRVYTDRGVRVHLENNSPINPIFHTPTEIEGVLGENPALELLLDIPHVKDSETLDKIVRIKMPKIIHVADRNFSVEHEHLPIGEGEIDFKRIFSSPLSGFSGKVIFEITESDAALCRSKDRLIEIIREAKTT